VDYVVGLAQNQRLEAELQPQMKRARARYEKGRRRTRLSACFQLPVSDSGKLEPQP
jgi:hypothetical protein